VDKVTNPYGYNVSVPQGWSLDRFSDGGWFLSTSRAKLRIFAFPDIHMSTSDFHTEYGLQLILNSYHPEASGIVTSPEYSYETWGMVNKFSHYTWHKYRDDELTVGVRSVVTRGKGFVLFFELTPLPYERTIEPSIGEGTVYRMFAELPDSAVAGPWGTPTDLLIALWKIERSFLESLL